MGASIGDFTKRIEPNAERAIARSALVRPAAEDHGDAFGMACGATLRRAGRAQPAIQTTRLTIRRMVHARQGLGLRHPFLSRPSAIDQTRTPADAPGRRRVRE